MAKQTLKYKSDKAHKFKLIIEQGTRYSIMPITEVITLPEQVTLDEIATTVNCENIIRELFNNEAIVSGNVTLAFNYGAYSICWICNTSKQPATCQLIGGMHYMAGTLMKCLTK